MDGGIVPGSQKQGPRQEHNSHSPQQDLPQNPSVLHMSIPPIMKKAEIQLDFGYGGAASQIRTGDLILTKDALYRLSYSSILACRVTHTALPLYNGIPDLSRVF